MSETMNVYKKLQTCRKELRAKEVKESGNNKFAGYTYMELGDFLPHIIDLCDHHGLCTVISFADLATLTVINSDKPEEQIVFTSPMSTAELKGCHAIQNLGAVETYLRRYLYVAAFDIVEHDALDSTQGKDQHNAPERYEKGKQGGDVQGTKSADVITGPQTNMLKAKMKAMGAEESAFKEHFGIQAIELLPKTKMNDALKFIEGK